MKNHCKRLVGEVKCKKFRQVLGLIILLLLLGVNTLWAKSAYAQQVQFNIQLKNATIEQVFDAVRQQSQFEFFYNNDQVNANKKVNVSVKEGTIEAVLNSTLGNEYSYKIEDRYILVSKNEKMSVAGVRDTKQQSNVVTGIVRDHLGEPVIGASVIVKGTNTGSATDTDGKYSVQVNPGQVLVFSYLGYKTTEKVVGNEKNIDIKMVEDSQLMDEVVVVGFGGTKKANLTGAVSSVKMADVLGSRPVSNTAQALAGSVPGLRVTMKSGGPGATTDLNIRGAGQIVLNTDNNKYESKNPAPLILVDNVPIEDLSLVNPEDIETVSVLKDAAASAIHGARAAFGVVLITTKKGTKEQKARISYSNTFTFSSPLELAKKASTLQNVQAWMDAGFTASARGGGQDLSTWKSLLQQYATDPSQYADGYSVVNGIRYDLAEKDIYRELLDNSGFEQAHNLSVSGGSQQSNYRMSFGYTNEDGVMVTDKDNYTRYNGSVIAGSDITKWLNAQAEATYSRSDASVPNGASNGGYWSKASSSLPTYPSGESDFVTPGEMLPLLTPANMVRYGGVDGTRRDDIRLVGRLVVTPITDLKVTGEFTYNNNRIGITKNNVVKKMVDADKWAIAYLSSNKSSFYKTNSFNDHTALNIFANYNKIFNKVHSLGLTAGFNQEYNYYEYLQASNTDMINTDLPSISGGGGTPSAQDNYLEYAVRGVYYRASYDYKGKYLFEMNGRYDGSSRFPKEDRFGFFPSVSAGWRVMEEGFMESLKPVLTNFKPRVSWGNIGNQNIGNYEYISEMKTGYTYWANGNALAYRGMGAPALVSNSFTWEKIETLDFGLDFGLFNNRLSGVFDWYDRKTIGSLSPGMELPAVLGSDAPRENNANLQTKGWELEINWNDRIGSIAYHIGFNVFDSQSEVTKFDGNETKLINKMYAGQKVGEIWGLTTDRYYTQDDFSDYTKGVLKEGISMIKGQTRHYAGDVLYKDLDGDHLITTGIDNGQTLDKTGDYRVIGNNTPRYNYGINGGLSWANFDFSFLLQGVGKRDIWYGDSERNRPFNVDVFGLLYANLTDYWTPENPNAKYPRFYTGVTPNGNMGGGYNYNPQTKYLRSGAFMRIKNLTLGYTLPKNVLKKIAIEKLRFYVSAENVHTFKSTPDGLEPDLDKEEGSQLQYPFMRKFALGLNISF